MSSDPTQEYLFDILKQAEFGLGSLSAVVHVEPPFVVAGDIHGDMDAFEAVLELAEREDAFPIFLGDFIDRSSDGGTVAVASRTLELMIEGRGMTIRGNHENFLQMDAKPFDLEIELIRNYRDPSELKRMFGSTFSELPLCAVSKSVYMAHGGIPHVPLASLDKYDRDHAIDVTWGDPAVKPFHGITSFDGEKVKRFLDRERKRIFIRGHTPSLNRLIVYDRVLTIQSTGAYKERGAGGISAVLVRKEVRSMDDVEVFIHVKGWKSAPPENYDTFRG